MTLSAYLHNFEAVKQTFNNNLKCNKNIILEESWKVTSHDKDENCYYIDYKDEFLLAGGEKVKIKDLGLNYLASNAFFLDYLKTYNIPTGYRKTVDNSLLFQVFSPYPFNVNIINLIDKKTAKVFNRNEGEVLSVPIFDFRVENSKEFSVTESHLIALDICPLEDLKTIKRLCSKINAVLKSYFERRNTFLAEVCCSFGKDDDKIFVVDEFSPKSLKVLPNGPEQKTINPYKVKTQADFKIYADFILGLTKN